MHCELAVPALFAAAPERRLPALEMLLARARASACEPQSVERWLLEAFGVEDDALPAGALTMLGEGAEPGGVRWTRADPVHLRLARGRLVMVPGAALSISRDEAASLCEALNRHFAGVLQLVALRPESWSARLEREFAIDADSPLELAGREVDLERARGASPGSLQSLLNEAQMLLHAHPVNEAREARGEPAVNSLWLWGAGSLPQSAERRWHGVLADEPVALGLARLAGARHRPLPPSAAAWLERAPQDGRHLVVLDALRAPFALSQAEAWREALLGLERQWFAPLLDALRAGRLGMVTVHVPEAGASFEIIRGDLRRFWRRPRALQHYA